MSMLRLRQVGTKIEASNGDRYVGDIDPDHFRDFAAKYCGAKLSRTRAHEAFRASFSKGRDVPSDGSVGALFAAKIADRQSEMLKANPALTRQKAFLLAKDQVLKETPALGKAYRVDVTPLRK